MSALDNLIQQILTSRKGSIGSIDNVFLPQIFVKHANEAASELAQLREQLAAKDEELTEAKLWWTNLLNQLAKLRIQLAAKDVALEEATQFAIHLYDYHGDEIAAAWLSSHPPQSDGDVQVFWTCPVCGSSVKAQEHKAGDE